ncbi:hypothetical protein QN277_008080 [Acacia crassicarpa]|uniref:Uncharacterized protein n=1 Tax=Acacia crassicarpa TaxID=499986 RepID=A0AAE1IRH5_9FABA|nr:hypothetical protein QN277_008080 [Acacia crassicarpa]
MAANPSSFQKNQANFPDPPKRGNKIKAQMFEGLIKSVASAVSKAGESLGKVNGGGGGNSGGSASSTPLTSAYNSDAS